MSGGQIWGFDSIGAIATQKMPTDALNLGFPSAYQSVYSAKGPPQRFFPQVQRFSQPLGEATGVQADWHRQKKADADHMALSAVASERSSDQKAVSSAHGMYNMPTATLGQRKYANPSNGAYEIKSGRQDAPNSAPFHLVEAGEGGSLTGGVLRSAEGQAYGKARLLARVNELNRIGQAKMAFLGQAPLGIGQQAPAPAQGLTATPTAIGESTLIELNLLLQGVIDTLVSSDQGKEIGRFTFGDATRALKIIFRLAPTVDANELDEVFSKVDVITNLLNGVLEQEHHDDEYSADSVAPHTKQIALTLQVLFTKLREYLQRMVAGVNYQPAERLALSKSLVKALGFSKVLKYTDTDYNEMLSAEDRARLLNAQQNQIYQDIGQYESASQSFSRSADTRENMAHSTETGVSRSDRSGFTHDERQSFGYNSGSFFGTNGRSVGWFGEVPSEFGDSVWNPPISEERTASYAPTAHTPSTVGTEATGPAQGRRANPLEFAFQGNGLHRFFDPDTQAFNVAVRPQRRR